MKIADAKIRVPAAAPGATRTRRTYARQFKSEVVAQCQVPGASVLAIALGYGINANVIRKWLPQHGSAVMLPVTVESAPVARSGSAMHTARAAAPAPIELTLAGATVRLPAGFDREELR
ncbi:MAG: transposase, partial [Caldisericota bacterium]|nr:transposase [Caldisericota bacterium]